MVAEAKVRSVNRIIKDTGHKGAIFSVIYLGKLQKGATSEEERSAASAQLSRTV